MVDAIPRLHVALEGGNRYPPSVSTVLTPRQEEALCQGTPKEGRSDNWAYFELKTRFGPHFILFLFLLCFVPRGGRGMKFISTRDVGEPGQPTKLYSLEEAVLKGWADDGGMLMPTELPNLEKELRDWSESNKCISYKDLTIQILSLFIDKTVIDEDELAAIVQDAFKRFDIDEIISLQKLNTTVSAHTQHNTHIHTHTHTYTRTLHL